MKAYLKVKIKSLAAEAQIIRREERRFLARSRQLTPEENATSEVKRIFWGLRQHRIWDVRREARSAGLAYGFIRGRGYRQIEAKCYEEPHWSRVAELVRKYGNLNLTGDQIKKALMEWRNLDVKWSKAA
jgi:hypothetical protein